MNNIFKKVLSTVEEFASRSNRLSLAADSILDRIVPKGTAHAGCYIYRTVWEGCFSCPPPQPRGRMRYERAFCDGTPCNTSHCGPWQTYKTECWAC